MKIIYSLFPFLGIYLFLISAIYIERKENPKPGEAQVAAVISMNANIVTPKLNFFQKLSLKLFIRKNEQAETTKADKLALTSLILGIGAFSFFFLGYGFPFLFVGVIPLAIAAFITGRSAVKQGTTRVGIAKTGKGLGIVAIILLALFLIVGVIFLNQLK